MVIRIYFSVGFLNASELLHNNNRHSSRVHQLHFFRENVRWNASERNCSSYLLQPDSRDLLMNGFVVLQSPDNSLPQYFYPVDLVLSEQKP